MQRRAQLGNPTLLPELLLLYALPPHYGQTHPSARLGHSSPCLPDHRLRHRGRRPPPQPPDSKTSAAAAAGAVAAAAATAAAATAAASAAAVAGPATAPPPTAPIAPPSINTTRPGGGPGHAAATPGRRGGRRCRRQPPQPRAGPTRSAELAAPTAFAVAPPRRRAGSAALRGARRPSSPSPPSCRHRPTHHECSQRRTAHTQEGCSFFQPRAPTTVVSTGTPPSDRVRRAVQVPLPLAAFAALLLPRPSPRPHRRRGAAVFNIVLRQS